MPFLLFDLCFLFSVGGNEPARQRESHVNLKLNQPAKKQALETIAILKKTMRIEQANRC